MSTPDIATVAVAVVTVIGSFIGSVRWLVKHYLGELKNNGGSTWRDQTDKKFAILETRVDTIIKLLKK